MVLQFCSVVQMSRLLERSLDTMNFDPQEVLFEGFGTFCYREIYISTALIKPKLRLP